VDHGDPSPIDDAAAPPDGGSEPHIVFVTSGSYTVLEVHDGDRQCNEAVQNTSLQGRTFKAWTTDPSGAPAKSSFTDWGPWYLMADAGEVADNLADVAGSTLLIPIHVDQRGHDVGDVYAWTGAPGLTCDGWTNPDASAGSQCGESTKADGDWLATGICDCSSTNHLYCFEQP
jgi:hypothetical protein